jgi:HD-GYP domain-containing protein (c-di-GMP phosphodiesterase class II)
MFKDQTISMQYEEIIQRVNHIFANTGLQETLDQILGLFLNITQAPAGMLYIYDVLSNELIINALQGISSPHQLIGTHIVCDSTFIHATLQAGRPVFIDGNHAATLHQNDHETPDVIVYSLYYLPLVLGEKPVGMVKIFNPAMLPNGKEEPVQFLHLLSMLIAPHVERTHRLLDAQRRERRLMDLIDIMSCISTTLERDRLLDDIMNYAQELLEVEATSIWIKDEEKDELILHVATGERRDQVRELRVPSDQGIIGNVTTTGRTIVVNDVDQDTHFYRAVDQQSGFTTRSVLCVPMQAPRIDLGGERGELMESIIGGAQALNKRDGRPFGEEDVVLFEMLANQAATILQFSELYNQLARLYNELALLFNETQRLSEQNYKMFWGIIKGITSFIDRKDPYTRGHSVRVSEFSVAIARQLGLPREMIEHIHIGGILHDVGKIGVPDEVLKKPSRLTDEEMEEMKLHPTHGMQLLEESDLLWLLPIESQAIEEHHERLDGSGYPKGLHGKREEGEEGLENEQGISLIGRIVAVADAFDAMTSDRPYRPGMSVEKALSILREESGTGLDALCVEALVQARENGKIIVQSERSLEHQPLVR